MTFIHVASSYANRSEKVNEFSTKSKMVIGNKNTPSVKVIDGFLVLCNILIGQQISRIELGLIQWF